MNMTKEALLKVERGFWFGDADYYHAHLADDGVFVFPGMRLDKADGIAGIEQMPRWDDVTITDEQLIELGIEYLLLSYRAQSVREGTSPYVGNITSIYRLEEKEPKLFFHQHTPDPVSAT